MWLSVVMYKVVEFTDKKEVAVVASDWLDGTSCCLWPPYNTDIRNNRAVKNIEKSDSNWKSYPIKILSETDCYDTAMRRRLRAEESSNIETMDSGDDHEDKRQSKRRRRLPERLIQEDYYSSDDSEEPPAKSPRIVPQCQLPTPPQKERAHTTMKMPSRLPPGSQATPRTSTPVAPDSQPAVSGRDICILTLLEKLRADVSQVIHKVNNILLKMNSDKLATTSDVQLPEEVELPWHSMEMVTRTEALLLNSDIEKIMVNYLGIIGGTTLMDTVRRTMKALMTNTIAVQFNWIGACGKKAFSNLKMKAVVIKAVRRNPVSMNSTEKEIEKGIKEWLRGAMDRDGGRKRRHMAALGDAETQQ